MRNVRVHSALSAANGGAMALAAIPNSKWYTIGYLSDMGMAVQGSMEFSVNSTRS